MSCRACIAVRVHTHSLDQSDSQVRLLPSRTLERSSRLGGHMRFLFTPQQARRNIVCEVFLFSYGHSPASSVLAYSAILDCGDRDVVGEEVGG